MCGYCNKTGVNVEHACKHYFIHEPFYIKDDYTREALKATGDNPVMYLREYREIDLWSLICEFADERGTVVEMPIWYCPICGRKLLVD